MTGLKIIGMGHALPENAVTNNDLSQIVDTNDEWITTRTGIGQRYFAQRETNVGLASLAAKNAIQAAGIAKEDIAYCVVTTFTPDNFTPSVSCGVAGEISLSEDVVAFDLNAACSGFVYGLNTVRGLLMGSDKKYALLIGSEIISRVMDMKDRSTCVLFGDGAAAAVVELSEDTSYSFVAGCRPDDKVLHCNTQNPAIIMDGSEVFRFAVDIAPKCIEELLKRSKLTLEDVDYVVCHQANSRIINYVVKKLRADAEKFYMNLQKYGNTSAASIPLALSEMWEAGLLKSGTRTLCVGFGAGLTYGGALLTW